MTKRHTRQPTSLLEPEARGGDTAEGGFTFQENVVVASVPKWLAEEGFTAMIREATGDAEAKFFIPGKGFLIEFVETKNHTVTPSEFWNEVKRFQELDTGSPGTYGWFTLVSIGLSDGLKPLINGLRRVRDAYGFYQADSAIKENSFKDYIQVVADSDHSEEDAHFLFERVLIEADLSTAQSHGEALFVQAIARHFQEYQNLPHRVLHEMYLALGALVRSRKNQPIGRMELETTLRERIDPMQLPSLRPVLVYTAIQADEEAKIAGLRFEWEMFFGGDKREFPPTSEWNRLMLVGLKEARDWIVQHRNTRRIRLAGNRRLSASLAIGAVFSAVAGFSVEMEYRNEIWATDAHPTSYTPGYPLVVRSAGGEGERLVVSIGILNDIESEVESDLERHTLTDMPRLHISAEQAIISSQQANVAVRAIKNLVLETLSRTGSKHIDLFFAGPSHLALFLGHRLNATTSIQCYERIASGRYVPTCRLF